MGSAVTENLYLNIHILMLYLRRRRSRKGQQTREHRYRIDECTRTSSATRRLHKALKVVLPGTSLLSDRRGGA